MAASGENIYGNFEVILKHESGPKPVKVCRPEGLGCENVNDYQEENIYANKDVGDDVYVVPGNDGGGLSNGEEYEPLDPSVKTEMPKTSGQGITSDVKGDLTQPTHRSVAGGIHFSDANSNTANFAVADRKGIRTQHQLLTNDSIEMAEFTRVAMQKGKQRKDDAVIRGLSGAQRWLFVIGCAGALIAIAAVILVLLFGFRKIDLAEEPCKCEASIQELRNQVAILKQDMRNLQDQVNGYKLQSSVSFLTPPSTTAPLFSTTFVMSSMTSSTVENATATQVTESPHSILAVNQTVIG